jgi:hypothetical protein
VGGSHEARDLRVRDVVLFGLVLTAVLVGSHYVLIALMSEFRGQADRADRPRPPVRPERLVPPEPRLEESNSRDLEALRKAEDERLGSYGWVDRDRKVLRIPIDRAIDQLLRRGVPARAPVRGAD